MLNPADLIIDPEFDAVLPRQSDEELEKLRVLVTRDGFRDPLVAWLGHSIIVDGMSRWRVWDQFFRDDPDRQPEIVEKHFADRQAVVRWIIETQMARRNLSAGQRALLVLRLKDELAADGKRRMADGARQGVPNSGDLGRTDDKLAEIAGVSPDSIHKASTVSEEAAPETRAAVLAGEKSLNEAYREVRPGRSRESQDPAASSERQARRLLGDLNKMLGKIRQLANSLQDEERAEFVQDLRELLGSLEGAE